MSLESKVLPRFRVFQKPRLRSSTQILKWSTVQYLQTYITLCSHTQKKPEELVENVANILMMDKSNIHTSKQTFTMHLTQMMRVHIISSFTMECQGDNLT